MTYDLRRLRLTGLIVRIPHTNSYALTTDGLKVAIFYTKLDRRLLHPLPAADQPPVPPALQAALRTIDDAITEYTTRSLLQAAA
jgi:hypothetical protein